MYTGCPCKDVDRKSGLQDNPSNAMANLDMSGFSIACEVGNEAIFSQYCVVHVLVT